MAGLGRRTFAAGEVLTASNVMGYLQDQAVMNFAGTAARGSAIASPSEGMVTYLADSNLIETYDGVGAWERQSGGLVPVAPASVTIATGSGSSNAVGVLTFTGATAVSFNGVFTSRYTNYRIIVTMTNSSVTGPLTMRYRASGADNSSGNYYQGGELQRSTGTGGSFNANADTMHYLLTYVATAAWGHAIVDVIKPAVAAATTFNSSSMGWSTSIASFVAGGTHDTGNVYDGFTIFPQAGGTISGTIQVFGYND